MTLATRCPTCATVFRVVQDQLRVADGWVRCGRCETLFDARAAIFVIAAPTAAASDAADDASDATDAPIDDRDDAAGAAVLPATTGASEAADAIAGTVQPDAQPGGAVPMPPDATTPPSDADAAEAPNIASAADASSAVAANRVRIATPGDALPAASVADLLREAAADGPLPAGADDAGGAIADVASGAAEPPAGEALPVPAADDTPSFMRAAERREHRDSRPVRAVLATAVLALLALLALQAAWRWRDTLAARWPAARPALGALCGVAGCRIDAPRRIGDLAVDSSALTRPPMGQALQLAVVLRNRGALAVAVPWVELTLTDAGGRLLARRVLAPADLRAASPTLAPGTDTPLQTELAFDGAPPAGYTLEIFYP